MGDVKNGLAVHTLRTGHAIAWDQAIIDDRETNWHRRRVKEALRIQQYQVNVRMNLDQGIILQHSWKRFYASSSCPPVGDHVTGSVDHVTATEKGGKNLQRWRSIHN